MATIKHIFKGESLSMLFAFPADYDMERIQSHGVWIGGTEFTGVIIGQGIELKLTSLQTDMMSGNRRVSLWIDDTILGVRKPYVGDIAVGNTNALPDNESTSEVYDVIVNVDISVTAIEAGDLMFNYVKGDPLIYDDLTPEQIAELKGEKGEKGDTGEKGDKGEKGDPFLYSDFTPEQITELKGEKGDKFEFSDFTPEQIALLQKPASDIATTVSNAEGLRVTAETNRNNAEGLRLSAEIIRNENEADRIEAEGLRAGAETGRQTAEGLRQQAEINRQTNTSTAISNAEQATDDANDAAILANEKADLANNAAILANEKAGLAATATTQANTARDGANEAATNADNARLAIQGDLAAKANQSDLANLAGEVDVLQGTYKINTIIGNNLLNPSDIESGKTISVTGAINASATYDISGYINVKENTQYSGKDKINTGARVIRRTVFFDAQKNVLSAKDGVHGTFTTPNNCAYVIVMFAKPLLLAIVEGGVAYYEDYWSYDEAVVENRTQLIGDNAVVTKKSINKLLKEYENIIVNVSSGTVLIRTSFNETHDLVRSITLNGSQNGASNLTSTKLILKTDSIYSPEYLLHYISDSMPGPLKIYARHTSPYYFNIGGNHGMVLTDLTANAHGKTELDLFSEWTDGSGFNFYITNIIDVNTLRIVGKPNTVEGFDKVSTLSSGTLTHVTGATNTESITFTANNYEYKPVIDNISVKLYLDDVEVISDGDYTCNMVKIIDTHEVADITQPNLVSPYEPKNNGKMAKNTIITEFFPNNSMLTTTILDSQKKHNYYNYNNIRPQWMRKTAYTGYKTYAMNVGIVGAHDFDAGIDFMEYIPSYIYVNKNNLKDQTIGIKSINSILFDGVNPQLGMGCGFNPLVGFGKSDYGLQNNLQFYISDNNKIYPQGIFGDSELNIKHGVEYMAYWDASVNPKLSADYYISHGKQDLYFLCVREAMTKEKVYLASELLNREYEVIHQSSGLTIHVEDATTSEGLIVSGVVGDWAVLKIK